MICLPAVSLVRTQFTPKAPKDLMPYEFVREETTRTFRGDNDYRYILRSRGSKEEFLQFVRAMDMGSNRITDDRFEKISDDKRMTTTIYYSDGWIVYEETFT